jgi:hypothetical protein
MIRFTFDASALDAALGALPRAVDAEFRAVVRRGGRRIAETAKRAHAWQNRTGRLERSITSLDATGDITAGSLRGGAVAGMPYAGYLERRPEFAFMEPALEASIPFIEEDAAAALERAIRRVEKR